MNQPATPVPSATVVLVRPGAQDGAPWECFMVRRHVLSDFAADVFVFPGGKVDDLDRSRWIARHVKSHRDPPSTDDGDLWRALGVAAIRELFEEAGVLIALRDGDQIRLEGTEGERFLDYRQEVQNGHVTMIELAEREELVYPLDSLHPISRWITPETFPRRFDTYFFVALMPEAQRPVHDERETTDDIWIAPQRALDRYAEGSFPLVYATEKNLEQLARHSTIEHLVEYSRHADLTPIMPRPIEDDGITRFLLPGDEGY